MANDPFLNNAILVASRNNTRRKSVDYAINMRYTKPEPPLIHQARSRLILRSRNGSEPWDLDVWMFVSLWNFKSHLGHTGAQTPDYFRNNRTTVIRTKHKPRGFEISQIWRKYTLWFSV